MFPEQPYEDKPLTQDKMQADNEATTLTYQWPPSYNYKCPDCHGEFNIPASSYPNGTQVEHSCPFCGRKMEGLKY